MSDPLSRGGAQSGDAMPVQWDLGSWPRQLRISGMAGSFSVAAYLQLTWVPASVWWLRSGPSICQPPPWWRKWVGPTRRPLRGLISHRTGISSHTSMCNSNWHMMSLPLSCVALLLSHGLVAEGASMGRDVLETEKSPQTSPLCRAVWALADCAHPLVYIGLRFLSD